MKKFKFLLIFGMLAGIIFVSMNANVTKIESIYITNVEQNKEYVEISGKLNDFYRLFKGYKYNVDGDKVYISVYTTFGLIGDKTFSIRIAANSDIKKVYITDGKDNRVIHTIQ